MPVAKMQTKSDMYQMLARLLSCKTEPKEEGKISKLHNFHATNDYKLNKAYLWSDKLSRQQADGRQCTVGQKWNGGPRIDDGVDVGKSFQELQSTTIPIPKWAMVAEEDFNRPESPPKNLVKTIRKIERCRTLERRPFRYAVD
jgi:hypothetical protein